MRDVYPMYCQAHFTSQRKNEGPEIVQLSRGRLWESENLSKADVRYNYNIELCGWHFTSKCLR